MDEPALYFDRSVGRAMPEALRILRVPNVILQEDFFRQDAADDEWLSFAGKHGWITFSQDYAMHREPAPIAAIRAHRVRVFYLWGANATRWEKMRVFARAYDKIIEWATLREGPFVCRVQRDGTLKDILA
jgi:hypothetical protein